MPAPATPTSDTDVRVLARCPAEITLSRAVSSAENPLRDNDALPAANSRQNSGEIAKRFPRCFVAEFAAGNASYREAGFGEDTARERVICARAAARTRTSVSEWVSAGAGSGAAGGLGLGVGVAAMPATIPTSAAYDQCLNSAEAQRIAAPLRRLLLSFGRSIGNGKTPFSRVFCHAFSVCTGLWSSRMERTQIALFGKKDDKRFSPWPMAG